MCKKRLDQILGSFSATKQPKSSLLTLLADRGSRGNREGRSQRGRQLDAVLDGGHALLALGLGAGKVKTRMRVARPLELQPTDRKTESFVAKVI